LCVFRAPKLILTVKNYLFFAVIKDSKWVKPFENWVWPVKMKKGYTNNGRIDYHICDFGGTCSFRKITQHLYCLVIVTTLWMGTIGFIDDYIKIFKKDKAGLKEYSKW
jgi:UDP-N-acetylmuramyl pentapeptide phosphotransferase/UDP-N-acetylglucosamine-1-phosphate transferase